MSLPEIFKPKKNFELIRFGRDNDGGYLVSKKTVLETKTLISFGILDDCSFENDFIKTNPIQVHCYDDTVNNSYWKKRFYNDLGASLYNLNWSFFKNTCIRYLEFKKFFKKKSNYLNIKKIITGSVRKIIKHNDFMSPLFFKIDIEGSEYRILDELIEFQDLLCGLAVEFHDLDLNLYKVENFIKNFNLSLTHIHPNNYGFIDSRNIPSVLEMTFEKNPAESNENLIFPNKFEQLNDPINKDIKLTFK
jgi:hypothetical protein